MHLFATTGMPGVVNFVHKIDVDVLIELVISRMANFPSSSPPDSMTTAELLTVQQAACAKALQLPAPAPAAVKREPEAQPATIPTLPPIPAPKPEPKPAPPPVAPPPRPPPKLRVTPLSAEDRLFIQESTIRNILQAPPTLDPALRTAMVAKLAPAAHSPEGRELLCGFKNLIKVDVTAALDLVITWLYHLFIRQCTQLPADVPEPSERTRAAGTEAATVYLSGLESVLSTLCDHTDAKDRTPGRRLPPITVLLTEAPLLPEGIARKRLEWLCTRGSDWGKVALLTMRELIKSKHSLKPVVLQLSIKQLLRMQDGDLKGKTVRMLANQVRSSPSAASRSRASTLRDCVACRHISISTPRLASCLSAGRWVPHQAPPRSAMPPRLHR